MSLRRFLIRGMFWGAYIVLSCGYFVCPCGAQTIHTQEVASALHISVHMRMGKTTLGKVTKALSQQTGQTIECADYLMDHRLTVQIDNASAEDVLNQLAELNNWTWKETDTKHVRIARARAVVPEKPLQIPAALKAVLPFDFQRYLGINVPRELWLTEDEQQKSGSSSRETVVSLKIQQKIADLRKGIDANVWAASFNSVSGGRKHHYPQWTPQVKEAVLLAMTANALREMFSPHALGMLNEAYTPFQRDPMLTEIRIHKNDSNNDPDHRDLSKDLLELGTETLTATSQRYQGFGSNMKFILTPLSVYLPMP